jgi:uncharacterized membrane protein YgdD (TMEM256/DUF423 family)
MATDLVEGEMEMRRHGVNPEGCFFLWFVSFGWVFFCGGMLVAYSSLEGFTGCCASTPLQGVLALVGGLLLMAIGGWPILYEWWSAR